MEQLSLSPTTGVEDTQIGSGSGEQIASILVKASEVDVRLVLDLLNFFAQLPQIEHATDVLGLPSGCKVEPLLREGQIAKLALIGCNFEDRLLSANIVDFDGSILEAGSEHEAVRVELKRIDFLFLW